MAVSLVEAMMLVL